MPQETIAPPAPILETPVMHSDAFLVRDANRAFLTGTTPYPATTREADDMTGVALTVGAVLLIAIGVGIFLNGQSRLESFLLALLPFIAGIGCFGAMLHLTDPKRAERERRKGRIVMGEVVESEKIRNYRGHNTYGIGIRYRFIHPDGFARILYRQSEAELHDKRTVPPVGTPLYIWVDDKGKDFLL